MRRHSRHSSTSILPLSPRQPCRRVCRLCRSLLSSSNKMRCHKPVMVTIVQRKAQLQVRTTKPVAAVHQHCNRKHQNHADSRKKQVYTLSLPSPTICSTQPRFQVRACSRRNGSTCATNSTINKTRSQLVTDTTLPRTWTALVKHRTRPARRPCQQVEVNLIRSSVTRPRLGDMTGFRARKCPQQRTGFFLTANIVAAAASSESPDALLAPASSATLCT